VLSSIIASLHGTIVAKAATIVRQPLGEVWGDSVGVEQVFANLVDNALKYLDPERPGVIEIGTIPRAGRDDQFKTCYVRDNGVGIAKASLQKVFQPLQRMHQAMAPGEGLGLAIVRRIVERHGGQVWVESAPGVGSTFFFELPRVRSGAGAGTVAAPFAVSRGAAV
jgi:signal transduction histidine kinase